MGLFGKWDDTPSNEAEETKTISKSKPLPAPVPEMVKVRLTKDFIKLLNGIDDIATANGWALTVAFPSNGIDLAYDSANYSFAVTGFDVGADCADVETIKKNLASAITEATKGFALGDYVYDHELSQLKDLRAVISEDDVRRYIREAQNIQSAIDGLVRDLRGPVKKPITEKKAPVPQTVPEKKDIKHNTDVIDAVNKAMAEKKPASTKKG